MAVFLVRKRLFLPLLTHHIHNKHCRNTKCCSSHVQKVCPSNFLPFNVLNCQCFLRATASTTFMGQLRLLGVRLPQMWRKWFWSAPAGDSHTHSQRALHHPVTAVSERTHHTSILQLKARFHTASKGNRNRPNTMHRSYIALWCCSM